MAMKSNTNRRTKHEYQMQSHMVVIYHVVFSCVLYYTQNRELQQHAMTRVLTKIKMSLPKKTPTFIIQPD